MADQPATKSEPRRRVYLVYALWGIGLGLLLVLAGSLEYGYKPWREVRDVLGQYEVDQGFTPEDVHPSASTRREAIRKQQVAARSAVEKLGGPGSAERRLLLYARLPEAWTPRRSYVVTLSEQCEDPVRMQIALLRNSDKYIRRASAEHLRTSRDSRAVEPLIGALKDSDESVACAAATALGALKDPRAIEPLKACLADSRQSVRDEAKRALGWLGAIPK